MCVVLYNITVWFIYIGYWDIGVKYIFCCFVDIGWSVFVCVCVCDLYNDKWGLFIFDYIICYNKNKNLGFGVII